MTTSSFAIILMGKRELAALLGLSSWCLVIVVWLLLAVPWVSLQFVIVVFLDHTHLLFFNAKPHPPTIWWLRLLAVKSGGSIVVNSLCVFFFHFVQISIEHYVSKTVRS